MHDLFIHRDVSWNAFNVRVLDEAMRDDLGLLDRLKFMAIVSSNYDEFFMVRIAVLMRRAVEDNVPVLPTHQTDSAILCELLQTIRKAVELQDAEMTDRILPALAENGLSILSPADWTEEEDRSARMIFQKELFAAATPVALENQRKLIVHAARGHIHAAFTLNGGKLAIVSLPENLNRFREMRTRKDRVNIVLLEDILLSYGQEFFPGCELEAGCLFRVTRDADMTVDEECDEDFVAAMEEVLDHRKEGFPVRLETRGDRILAGKLRDVLELPEENHFHLTGPLKLKDFLTLSTLPEFSHLQAIPPAPKPARDLADFENFWDVLKDRDVLLHHPYESYTPVVRMVEEAAESSNTLAIKMTLYRVSGKSPIIQALIRAAERGIQVTVVIELKARFDEGANITWSQQLRKAGAIVVYGLAMLKVHAKMLMVVRREPEGIRRYVHMGTGNYNESTASMYTDMGLMTSREEYTKDAALVFNAITGYSSEPQLSALSMAPFSLRRETLRLISREEKRAKGGEEARIVAKVNALIDREIIAALYAASSAGVKIDLNVRGICCLKPGLAGLSENIRVVSVIDSYLEHTRAFAYYNGGSQDVYLSSADWMTRNLDRRVELLFPISDPSHKRRILSVLSAYFRDNCQAWVLQPDGAWKRRVPQSGDDLFRVQEHFAFESAALASERDTMEKQSLRVRREADSQAGVAGRGSFG